MSSTKVCMEKYLQQSVNKSLYEQAVYRCDEERTVEPVEKSANDHLWSRRWSTSLSHIGGICCTLLYARSTNPVHQLPHLTSPFTICSGIANSIAKSFSNFDGEFQSRGGTHIRWQEHYGMCKCMYGSLLVGIYGVNRRLFGDQFRIDEVPNRVSSCLTCGRKKATCSRCCCCCSCCSYCCFWCYCFCCCSWSCVYGDTSLLDRSVILKPLQICSCSPTSSLHATYKSNTPNATNTHDIEASLAHNRLHCLHS